MEVLYGNVSIIPFDTVLITLAPLGTLFSSINVQITKMKRGSDEPMKKKRAVRGYNSQFHDNELVTAVFETLHLCN